MPITAKEMHTKKTHDINTPVWLLKSKRQIAENTGKHSFRHLILSVMLITVYMLVLTSCGSDLPKLSKDKPLSINIWHHFLGEQKVSFDKLVEEFNSTVGAKSGITVKAYSMDNTGDIHQKLLDSASKEPGSIDFPEMATAYPSTAFTLYNMGMLTSFEKYMTKNELEAYYPSFLEEGRLNQDSGYVIFPIAKSTEALYINYTFYKQFIDEYNSSNPPKKLTEDMLSTFEGIQETAQAYYEWTDSKTPDVPNDGKALFGIDAASNYAIITYKQLGSDFFVVNNDNTGEIDLNSPSMKSIWNTYFVPMIKGYYGAYSFYRSEDTQTGDLIMYIGSTAGASFFPKTVTYPDNTMHNIELKVLPYPSLKGGKKIAVQQGAGVIVSKSTPEKEYASVVFLKWLTEPERNIEFVLKTGYMPVTKEAIDLLPEEISEYSENGLNENVVKVLQATYEMMKTHEFYTYKPFKSSDDIRYSFEDKLISYTGTARNEFVERLKESGDFEASVDEIVNDQRFDQFLTEVRHEVLKVVK